jgi:hypothetical protein
MVAIDLTSDRKRVSRKLFVPTDVAVGVAILGLALVIGLVTAGDYGVTIDEFNTNDYGPKALAWYTSGFTDRSQFETVEFSLWYYGPWFQMLTAAVQSLGLGDPLTIRHALTFLVGLTGLAALLPLGRWTFGPWTGPAALVLCLTTGYLYGSLFFTPIDVPFLAAMMWATAAIVAMARRIVPSWPATLCAGLATGLAIATRTGGIITHAYLVGAMALCALEALLLRGAAARAELGAIAARTLAVVALAWLVAIALWPWLQIGNPFSQFKTAFVYFATLPLSFEFDHWGGRVVTDALPWSYIPAQWLARLPLGFVILVALAALLAIASLVAFATRSYGHLREGEIAALHGPALALARERRVLLIWVAVIVPIGFLIVQRATLYDGVRHVLFTLPILALIAASALVSATTRLLVRLRPAWQIAAGALAALYVAVLVANLASLHPLEYVAMNALVGGTRGAYGNFELDYWSAAATEALRRLEQRIDAEAPDLFASAPPSIVVCIPFREYMTGMMLRRSWRIELDPKKADFVIETQRSRCAGPDAILIDEVTRADRPFAWTYVNPRVRWLAGERR